MKRIEEDRSPWVDGVRPGGTSPVVLPSRVDVAVVGAGIAGLSIAYPLAMGGKSVLVLDDGPVGRGQTGQTTAHLSSAIDDRFSEVERIHGVEAVRLAHDSHADAVRQIQSIAEREHIDCDYVPVDGYLVPAAADQASIIEREWESLQRAGVRDVERVEAVPGFGLKTGVALRFLHQGQFHPLKYLNGLVRAIERQGGQVVTGRHVQSVDGGPSCRLEVPGEEPRVIHAGAVAVATNSPIHLRVAIHTKQAPYLTYAIALRIPRGALPRVLIWDTEDPYHYVRAQPAPASGDDLLIVGGEDHKTGHEANAEERQQRLEAWARARFPEAGAVAFRWCGQVQETIDGLGFLGRCPSGAENLYIATGDSGMGMTHGAIAGKLISDLILGRANPWVSLYDPARKPLRALWDYFKENVDVGEQYASLLTAGEVSSTDAIAPGHGAILRRGLSKVAVFRDDSGTLVERSALCPHLGCVVRWNPAARSWDCPCHGSRFDATGQVIVGPANSGLKPVE